MKKLIKRGLITIATIPIIMLIIIIVLFIIFPMLNNIKAGSLAHKWSKSLSVPNNIEIIEIIHGCGNTTGTGNHVEIWAAILIKTDLSSIEIKNYFGDEIFDVDKCNTQTHTMTILNKEFKILNDITEHDGYYIVEKIEDSSFSIFDLRGH